MARAIRRYLEAITAPRTPRRGPRFSRERVEQRLREIRSEWTAADTLRRVELVQERMDLERQLADVLPERSGTGRLEDDFVRMAKAYGERKGITNRAWQEMGVGPRELRNAGIVRASGAATNPSRSRFVRSGAV